MTAFRIATVIVFLVACSKPPKASNDTPVILKSTWIEHIADDASSFERLMETSSRAGWIAYHSNQFEHAQGAFAGVSKADQIWPTTGDYRTDSAVPRLGPTYAHRCESIRSRNETANVVSRIRWH